MSRPYLSQPTDVSIPGITKYQADNFYINNEEHTNIYRKYRYE